MSMRHKNRVEKITTVDGVQYKLNRVIDKTAEDIHHIISRQRRHEFNTENPKNKIKINKIKHMNLNKFFWERQDPKRQLAYMLDIRKTALSEEVNQALFDILNLPDEIFYDYDLSKRHVILKNTIW